MSDGSTPNRRGFFVRTAALGVSAASYDRILGANERVRVANVGCGRRQLLRELMTIKDDAQLQVTVVCDTWKQRRDLAVAQVKEFTGAEPYASPRLDDTLGRNDVDAVVIGTPDHLHCTQLIEAVRAGKDVYVEKPLAMNMRELIRAYDAVKKSGRIVQVGTQMRSYPQTAGTKEFIASGGLGKILKVEQVRNSYSPYWMGYGRGTAFDGQPTEADTDWKSFLGDRKTRPFDPMQYQGWYGFRDFSRGPHTNLMVHFIDLVHYVTGIEFPKRVVALGNTYRWKDRYDAPDSVEVALEYPGPVPTRDHSSSSTRDREGAVSSVPTSQQAAGLMVRYCTVFGNGANNYAKWFGTRGTLDAKSLSARQPWTATSEGSGEPDKLTSSIEMPSGQPVHHMKNWIDCIRTRQQPIAPIEAGYAHSVAVILADEAMQTGRRLGYDHSKREIVAV
jgi:predicted dehydrogenase